MSLSTLLGTVEYRRKSMTVYDGDSDLKAQFAGRNVTVETRQRPVGSPNSFAVFRDEHGYLGAVSLPMLESLLKPPIRRPGALESLEDGYRALFELLDDTLFASLDRRQLLAATREIEDRAWRIGYGTLHVGFQSLDAFEAQTSVYSRLAEETELDIHVYAVASSPPENDAGVTFHTEPTDEIERFWFLAFDGGDDDEQACALVAEEVEPDAYSGFWTYDPALVADVFAAVDG